MGIPRFVVPLICLFWCVPLGAQTGGINIIPTPNHLEVGVGRFTLRPDTTILWTKEGLDAATYLQGVIARACGFKLKIASGSNGKNTIALMSGNDVVSTGLDGYALTVRPSGVTIWGGSDRGIFYGVQSLLQLFPPEIMGSSPAQGISWSIPVVEILDQPRYRWRSFMLDSGRQYQKPEFIKRCLDWMALLKLNVFHWHLTEGQGWRIEIKGYPKLTSIGSRVARGREQQGFYTQREMREIQAYAARRFITVVPEIDVPGHSEAALSAYPEHSCLKAKPKSVMGFSPHLFCAGREKTYEFLNGVFAEVCAIFPGEYIHIGGDEAPKKIWNKCPDCQQKIKELKLADAHALQIHFTNRLATFLASKGRKTICWGDVVTKPGPALHKSIVVMWWNWRRHRDLGLKAALKRGHQVICCPNYYSYLNFPLTPWSRYGKNRTFDLRTTYTKNPADLPLAFTKKNPNVIGLGSCLWTDWFVQEHMINRRVFPRIFSLAQQMWHRGEAIPFTVFYKRVKAFYPRLKVLGIKPGPALTTEVPKDYKWD